MEAAMEPPVVEQPTAVEAEDGSLDKLTALEMLQFLKEYKKREFLFVHHIAVLQKELHLLRSAQYQLDFSSCVPHVAQRALLDPTVNLEIRELRHALHETETELQKARDELKASTFSAESVMGRRLINKCKALQEENTDIGKMLLENQLLPLQLQLGILEKQLAFFKKQLVCLHELNADLDRDNQSLVKQLHETTRLYKEAEHERDHLKAAQARQSSAASPRRRSASRRRSSRRKSPDHDETMMDHESGGRERGGSRRDERSPAAYASRNQSPRRRRRRSGERRKGGGRSLSGRGLRSHSPDR